MSEQQMIRSIVYRRLAVALLLLAHAAFPLSATASEPAALTRLLGPNDACYLADPNGRLLVSINIDQPLVPASMLKIFTALTAYHYLGAAYRFQTDIFTDSDNNLKIKGYGDPRLTSEVLCAIADAVVSHRSTRPPDRPMTFQNLVLDPSFFLEPLVISGVSESFEPYDAPNGALCANFNTVSFVTRKTGEVVCAEAGTPLLPSVLPRIRDSRLSEGRIGLSHHNQEPVRYAGQLFAFFLKQRGISFTGHIEIGTVDPSHDTRLLTFTSPFSLEETLADLLAFSNNFIANQLFITAGATAYGPPGTVEKGVRAADAFARKTLGITGIELVEGSGISRENRISAATMAKLLAVFLPHRGLMRQTERESYKTGTLTGVATRAGYLKGREGKLFPFVAMINSASDVPPRAIMGKLMDSLYNICLSPPASPVSAKMN